MAGKIIADQIQSTTAGTLDTKYVVNGSAKAWVNFNGTGTVAIRDSFNTSSMTDNSTGSYNQNFSSTLSNNDYSSVGGVSESGVGGQPRLALGDGWTTSYVLILGVNSSNNASTDWAFNTVTTNGDLA